MNVLAVAAPARWGWTPSVGQLGRVEARRLLRHPAYLLAVAPAIIAPIAGAAAGQHGSPWLVAYTDVGLVAGLFYPLMTLVAAYRVAASTHRANVRDPLAAAPMLDRRRTLAVIGGVVRGPVLVGVALMLLLDLIAPFVHPGRLNADQATRPIRALGLLDHAQLPVLVLGGGLLGVALARWVPLPGMAAVAPLTLWFGLGIFVVAGPTPSGSAPASAWFAPLPTWITKDGGTPNTPTAAENLWHLGYLLGLSTLAAMASLLRYPGGRRPLLAISAVLAVATAIAGIFQIR
jgi:hypothetical protein